MGHLKIYEVPIEHPLALRQLGLEASLVADEVGRNFVGLLVDEGCARSLRAVGEGRQRDLQRRHICELGLDPVVIAPSLFVPQHLLEGRLPRLRHLLAHGPYVLLHDELQSLRLPRSLQPLPSRCVLVHHELVNHLATDLSPRLDGQQVPQLLPRHELPQDLDVAQDIHSNLLYHHLDDDLPAVQALPIDKDGHKGIVV